MKQLFKLAILPLAMLLSLASCQEMFLTNPDDVINVDDYIGAEDEMYKGFMGILTKMQEAADHSILLTDTRSDFLEVTANAPLELQQIYQYADTKGNSYADPAPYYAIVVACNDYFHKMNAYRESLGNHLDEKVAVNFECLISSSLRLKVWAYLKLLSIYGEAVWFDHPLDKKIAIEDTTVFHYCDKEALVERCLHLLENGATLYDGSAVSANLTMDWASWINEEVVTENYNHWKYIVPEWLSLSCELKLWRGRPEDYLWVRNTVIQYLWKVHHDTDWKIAQSDWRFACNIPIRTGADNQWATEYYRIFFNERYSAGNNTNFLHVVTGVMYDYGHQQTNRIVEYFCPRSPGKYYLRPSSYSIRKYAEPDMRGFTQRMMMDVIDGDTCMSKYYYYRGEWLRTRIVEIHPVIPLFRGHDYHFYLAEAENHLGQWHQASVVMNAGVTNEFADKTLPSYWHPDYQGWFGDIGGYGDVGVVGCVYGHLHDFPKGSWNKNSSVNTEFRDSKGKLYNEEERMRQYDLEIMEEALNEYIGEGRAYAYVCRMAERYGAEYVVDYIARKYEGTPYYDQVKSSILAGNYWVKWDLKADFDK